jgi:hypothetical protein
MLYGEEFCRGVELRFELGTHLEVCSRVRPAKTELPHSYRFDRLRITT